MISLTPAAPAAADGRGREQSFRPAHLIAAGVERWREGRGEMAGGGGMRLEMSGGFRNGLE